MTQRGRKTTLEERVEISARRKAGETDSEIAAAMNRSVWTVRKWRRRYQREERAGMFSPMGRPASGALGSYALGLRDRIRQMRRENPGWGASTILAELEGDPCFAGMRLPSRSRMAAFLKQEGLTRKYERHSELPQPQTQAAQEPHEEWEVDAKGVIQVPALGAVSLIHIGDLVSRLKIDSLPCLNTSHPSTQDYQLVLRRAFVHYGLPERVSLDHDSVFYDNASASPYPTPLHLWLIALGVVVRFIDKRPPLEHSVIERLHQTLVQQAIAGQAFTEGETLQQRLTDRLAFLTLHLPCRTLGGQPPLIAYPEARHSGRPYRLEWEEDLLDLQRVYDYLAQGRWFRQVSSQGQFSLGAQRYGIGPDFADQTVEITFDALAREWVCLSEDGEREAHVPVQRLSKSVLMGELNPLLSLPAYQLTLPFSLSAWREMTLCNDLTGMTL